MWWPLNIQRILKVECSYYWFSYGINKFNVYPKRARREGVNVTPLWFSQKFIRCWNPAETLYQKTWRLSLSILAIFIDFHNFLGLFDVSLLGRWCQHFFIFNIQHCLTIVQSYNDIRLFILEIWRGWSNWPHPRKIYPQKSQHY